MSLENSQYTFHSLQDVSKEDFNKEVDRITKEVDQAKDDGSAPGVPAKRGRYTQEASSQSQPSQVRPVSGTILEVVLEDFLCHANMKVTLNKEINFIVGRNGSGKSAILTALVVALGGSASTTGRGAALKDFIKHGCNSARVTCVISNAGAMSYKKEIYGEKISVVRTLHGTGGSAIKLRSERGKLISSKMEDLRAMTLQLGIQVDNPISVLDQNTARHFLAQSKPENKFELFMRATNLDTLQKIYVDITLSVDKIKQEIAKKERQLVDNNLEVKEAERMYKLLANLEIDRDRTIDLKMELLWAEVRDYMINLQRVQKDLAKAQKEKQHLEKVLSSAESTETEPLLQEIESLKTEVKAFEDEKKDYENNLKELKIQYSALTQKLRKIEQEKCLKERRIKDDMKTINEYKSEIRSQEQKMLPEHVEMRRKQKEEIHELQKLKEQKTEIRNAKDREAQELQRQLSAAKSELFPLQQKKRQHEETIRSLSTTLQGLQSNESNLSLFGPNMPELVRQIELCNKFKKRPVGPLGAYVKVKDPKWALAVECAMKSRLSTFVVENIDDQRLLQSLIKKTMTRGHPPSVVRCAFTTSPFDTSGTAARTSEYCNVLDIVEITNVVARNMLVDSCSLEKIMLIPSDDECYRLLSNVRSVPRNCGRAFTLNADTYMPAPRYGSYASNQRSATILQQSSRAEIISQTQQQIEELRETLQAVQQSIATTSNDTINISKQLEICRNAQKKLSAEILSATAKLERLKDIEQPDTNSVSVLREELQSREQELLQLKNSLDDIPAKVKFVEAEKDELKLKGSDVQAKLKEVNDRIENHQIKQKTCRDQLDELQSAKAGKKRKLEQVSKQEDQLIVRSNELEEKHTKARDAAVKYEDHVRSDLEDRKKAKEDREKAKEAADAAPSNSQKVEEIRLKEFQSQSNTKRNVEVIDRELRTLNKKLASAERALGENSGSIEVQYKEKLIAYKTTEKYIIQLKVNAEYMKLALEQRKGLYHTQKKLMNGVVSHQFTRVLRFRNCTGTVRVNFERKTLDISVGPVDEGERAGLGTSSLSGGERSYATMAFVIALWNVTELPFYYLDEFDVFMDMLNRQTVLTLLLRFAKQKVGFQFGFLTPLDTTAITGSDRVTIFRLADPRGNPQ
ncbi:structural maintenance of chromosomes protein 6-like isoform X2 [Frankliniella occidentalis]|uniref:Structural maintenance of chromosomes protein 6-like isoform X2 n=1 Tax=Frankliniella occidentalis TaxID=133901 RepID=A0A9C6TUL8_FRAOC|nr:structural maintenance of chromosomes protein 6-like isoform X2 [Frankliniella occidentalis]